MMRKKEQQQHANYYEAIIQLRPLDPRLLEFVKDECDSYGSMIAKIIEYKFGFDIYMDSRKLAVQIGKMLKKKFKGKVIVSKTLHTRHRVTSKLVYRITVLFKKEIEKNIKGQS